MKRLLILAALAVMLGGEVRAGFVVNFDDVSKWTAGTGGLGSYASNHVYSDSGMTFTGGPSLRNTTTSQNGFAGALGTYSWRLEDRPGVSWTATYNTVSAANSIVNGFGFAVRRWDGSPSPAFSIAYSLNGGTSFTTRPTQINNTSLFNSSDWVTYSASFGKTQVSNGDFVVRISSSGTTERIMVDNFSVSAVPEPTTGLLLGLGTLACAAFRRNRRVA
jgi:hypothetical protein